MKIIEKTKIEEKLTNGLPVSIKCGWRQHDVVNFMSYIGAQNLLQKLKINSMSIRTGNVEYIMTQKDDKCWYQKCDFLLSTPL